MDRRELFGALTALGVVPACGAGTEASAADHGKAGGPMSAPHFHFCGIHMAKTNPKLQFITQHFCAAHTGGPDGDVFQCTLYDGTGKNAKLIGVEYLISDAAYRKLPEAEKKYWHAHTYEVLGGGLIAPEMSPEEEKTFMTAVMTLWGKAWHTWPDPSTAVPMGEPLLIWSLMGPGQVDPELEAKRDKEFKVDTKKISAARVKEFGQQPPNVAVPKDINSIGRQWTNEGDDKPSTTPKK
ncbi:OBAP family protein [Gemmata sp. JC717]|uniref:OBAP family protein n=1 Tax=Gemmata algarum TaxID=2975278 RepID=UPI0021BB185F|nr:OBAP family protein [Gemmata algarum]MDY3551199.1 OBAP family protein [Gemmata algarum]